MSFLRKRESIDVEVDSRLRGNDRIGEGIVNGQTRESDRQIRQFDGQIRQFVGGIRKFDGQIRKFDGQILKVDRQSRTMSVYGQLYHREL